MKEVASGAGGQAGLAEAGACTECLRLLGREEEAFGGLPKFGEPPWLEEMQRLEFGGAWWEWIGLVGV